MNREVALKATACYDGLGTLRTAASSFFTLGEFILEALAGGVSHSRLIGTVSFFLFFGNSGTSTAALFLQRSWCTCSLLPIEVWNFALCKSLL